MKTRKAAMILVAMIMMFAFVSNAHAQYYVLQNGSGTSHGSGNIPKGQYSLVKGVDNVKNMQTKAVSSNNYTSSSATDQVSSGSSVTIREEVSQPSGSYMTRTVSRYDTGRMIENSRIRIYGPHTTIRQWSY